MKRFWEKRWLPFLALIPFLLYAAAAVWTSTRNVSQLPVLMYHHVSEDVASDMVISPARFEAHMTALKEHGWNSVTIRQLIEFGEQGTPLPDHPVLITFDDGYTSNLELAAPILERYGLNAVIFVIGINAGRASMPTRASPWTRPASPWRTPGPYLESGVLEVESHTFDLHQRADYGYSGREGVLPLADEPERPTARSSPVTAVRPGGSSPRNWASRSPPWPTPSEWSVRKRTGSSGRRDQSDRHLRLRPPTRSGSETPPPFGC